MGTKEEYKVKNTRALAQGQGNSGKDILAKVQGLEQKDEHSKVRW